MFEQFKLNCMCQTARWSGHELVCGTEGARGGPERGRGKEGIVALAGGSGEEGVGARSRSSCCFREEQLQCEHGNNANTPASRIGVNGSLIPSPSCCLAPDQPHSQPMDLVEERLSLSSGQDSEIRCEEFLRIKIGESD